MSNQVATTILNQMGGIRRLSLMIGAKDFISFRAISESEYGRGLGAVSFKFMRAPGKPNFIRIVLDPSDTYTVEFGALHGHSFKIVETLSDVYAEDLQRTFTRKTGLALSL
jgi:hypothetical protein